MKDVTDYAASFLMCAIGFICIIGAICLIKICFYQAPNGGYEQSIQLLRYSGESGETYARDKD